MSEITNHTSVSEIVRRCPNARRIFDRHGLKGCGGEHGPSEPLSFFAAVHHADIDELLREINGEMEHPSRQPYVYKETLQDYIYRRFFRAGIVVVLTVGCLWGAINLLQIAMGSSFLQLRLLPSIHAHAHAMIFGWVGMFVMGFAYQSFPRFKNTTLWRPVLANLIGSAASLEQTGSLLFRYPTNEDPCIAVYTPAGKLVAYSQACTHLSCAVVYDKSGNGLFCPCHHGLFNLEGQPIAGPPIRPLPRVQLQQRGDRIYAIGLEA